MNKTERLIDNDDNDLTKFTDKCWVNKVFKQQQLCHLATLEHLCTIYFRQLWISSNYKISDLNSF